MEVVHVRAHAGNKGNKKGVKLRAELMLNAGGEG